MYTIMKTVLLFKENGEMSEIKLKLQTDAFSPQAFPQYNSYTIYNNYVVFYNVENDTLNISILPFTSDRFNGEILVIKVDNDMIVNNFTVDMYLKILLKNKSEDNEMYYSSDSDGELIEDGSLFCL